MKRLYTLLIAILLTNVVWAQAPEKMSYQAVIRGTDNILYTNQDVSMQIGILQGSASGDLLYLENHTPATNKNGLISIEIGAGSSVSGSFTDIDWSKGPYLFWLWQIPQAVPITPSRVRVSYWVYPMPCMPKRQKTSQERLRWLKLIPYLAPQ